MIKQSVKKPFTVLVAAIAVMLLAVVSLRNATTDLLPPISTPYLMVVTTYPGASPEKVEEEVTKPMEQGLSTVSGVRNYTSVSGENYATLLLEFEDGTDMDAALVKVNTALDQIKPRLPEQSGSPSLLEMNMDMMATMYLAVSHESLDVYALSDYVNNTVIPAFQRQSGVASVSELGTVEEMVEVRLNEEAIRSLNDRLAAHTDERLGEAAQQLAEADGEIQTGLSQLERQQQKLADTQQQQAQQMGELTKQMNEALAAKEAYSAILTSQQANQTALTAERDAYLKADLPGKHRQVNEVLAQMQQMPGGSRFPSSVADAIARPETLEPLRQALIGMGQEELAQQLTVDNLSRMEEAVTVRLPQIQQELAALDGEIAATKAVLEQVSAVADQALENYAQVEAGKMSAAVALAQANAQMDAGKTALQEARTELDQAKADYQTARDAALKTANLDGVLTMDALSKLIQAQDFSLPAGYIPDSTGEQWLIKVGEEIPTVEALSQLVLAHVEGIGDITVADVATVVTVDNSADSYTRMNGSPAVVLSVFKGSTAGTSRVSAQCNAALLRMEEEEPGLDIAVLMDQGRFVDLFLKSIVSNILFGALLAVAVLALFLRSVRPTLVVAFSIPFSVLVALLLMYFFDISLNIMSMAGLALGIGMLVDNSIVVVENIYRLRGRGLSAPRAAVQGGKQVAGAIVSSTLTTVCVFLPLIFTTGMVRELMLPFAMTITFALLASLVVALTVVPCLGSVALNRKPKGPGRLFEALLEHYRKALYFCLKHKWVPLGLAGGLLAAAVILVGRMGIVVLPEMNSDQLYAQVTMDESLDMEQCYQTADQVTQTLLQVDGVAEVGAMSNPNALAGPGMSVGENQFRTYLYYLVLDEGVNNGKEVNAARKRVSDALEGMPGVEVTLSASGAGDMSAMMGSGLSIDLYGRDLDTLRELAAEIKTVVEQVEGFEEVSDGTEEADSALQVDIDKDAAMRKGLTVAQIYGQISNALVTEKTAASLTLHEREVAVQIVDERGALTVEELLDLPLEYTAVDETGGQTTETMPLGEVASVRTTQGPAQVQRSNGTHTLSVTAVTQEGYNTALLSREVEQKLADFALPEGYMLEMGGEVEQVSDMLHQMGQLLALGLILVYLVMVAQFQSLLSPFIILFTVPLAFTGGLAGLLLTKAPLSIVSLLGFTVLMGTVVNNGIVFVDYTNRLRLGGLGKWEALAAAGLTRLRPILMTTLTTVLAMSTMMFSQDITASMSRGMAVVVSGGLLYATLMTLFVVPVMYDLLYRKTPHQVDVGDDLDTEPDDAAAYLEQYSAKGERK